MEKFQIKFTNQIWQEDKMFVAYTPELDVSSCGKTPELAKKNLLEAVELFLEEAKKIGSLDDILKEAGFTKDKNKRKIIWQSPELLRLERLSLII